MDLLNNVFCVSWCLMYLRVLRTLVIWDSSYFTWIPVQKQSSGGVLRKRCSENMRQTYRRTPMPKCDFNKVAKQLIEIAVRHGCSPVNLLHIFRTPYPKNTSEWLLLPVLHSLRFFTTWPAFSASYTQSFYF